MKKDLKTAFKSWYVIDNDEHLKMGSFDDALIVMKARALNNKENQLIMMSDKEYSTWDRRKTKKIKK